ncbi:hypothetical protein Ga0074812_102128 [Parafrankia irregularis]|uniref:Uncharacterized protein n=1 Tax=Parafrankia irregularis TaxID=795642 RepID=A0A0S4QF87_9ACTN|nr:MULTISPECIES: hypothetical protein [Parafrankia]CUU54125.1 hypothetical protein Ga0074812_102128 [Parafrankia irregularis]
MADEVRESRDSVRRTPGFAMRWTHGSADVAGDPGVGLLPWGDDAWALVIPAGSSASALADAMVGMPDGLRFVEAFGDVDVVLVNAAAGVRVSRRDAPRSLLRQMLGGDPAAAGNSDGRWLTSGENGADETGPSELLVDVLRRHAIRRRTRRV